MIITQHPLSSISAIFMNRTSSTIYKNFIEMKVEWVNQDKTLWLQLEMYGELSRAKNFSIL